MRTTSDVANVPDVEATPSATSRASNEYRSKGTIAPQAAAARLPIFGFKTRTAASTRVTTTCFPTEKTSVLERVAKTERNTTTVVAA